MRKLNIEEKGSLILMLILVIMLISIIFFTLCPKVLNKLHLTNEKINNFFELTEDNNSINVDYLKLYPFDMQTNINSGGQSVYNKYMILVNKVKEKVESITSKGLYKYEKLIEFSYIYNNILKYDLYSNLDNSTISLGNNNFSIIYSKKNIDRQSNNIILFSNYLKDNNISLLYVQAPFKISDNLNISPIYKDSTNTMLDEFLNKIRKDVNYLDLRQNVKNENLNNLNLFFETDHHWLPETGLWATNIISNYLNEKYSINLEISNLNVDKYNYKKYNDIFLGSAGRRISLAKAKPENITLITPKFYTELNIKIRNLNIDKTGSYEETLINWDQLERKNYYKSNQYAAYMYGDQPLIEIHNELINNDKKILLVKDSFGDVVTPFLALENEYLSIIDLRHFNGSLKTYIRNYNPDIVIILYNGSSVGLDESNDESKKLWLFE